MAKRIIVDQEFTARRGNDQGMLWACIIILVLAGILVAAVMLG